MRPFQPTIAPPGRLIRLGVFLDRRNSASRLQELARMCERAGIDALWVSDEPELLDGEARLDAWSALAIAGDETSSVRVGAQVSTGIGSATELATLAGSLDPSTRGRLELTLRGDGTVPIAEYVRVLREHLPEPQPRISIEAISEGDVLAAVDLADDVLIQAASAAGVQSSVELVVRTREVAGRPATSLGIALDVPVSIGRTEAEAQARADTEPLFSTRGGHPAEVGIFGTLEQCQERVIRLAHDGVTELRCRLPNTPDVHDVIAQLTAMVVGSMDVLTPGAARSPDPEPPAGWGGRSAQR